MTKGRVLFVLTSHSELGDTGKKIGWYLPEFAHPYYILSHHLDVTVASPAGGEAPLDPSSIEYFKEDPECVSFLKDKTSLWTNTKKLSDLIGKAKDFDAIYVVGGHGPMFDLATLPDSHDLIREFYNEKRIVAAVCHGPAALVNIKLDDGSFLIKDSAVTGFANAEENAMGFGDTMPFSLEDELNKKSGGGFEKAGNNMDPWVTVAQGGMLMTGQNPASARPLAEKVLEGLGGK